MTPELSKCKKQSVKFFHNTIKYLDNKDFVDEFNETPFRYFVTVPLRNQFLSYDQLSSKLHSLIVMLNRKIFTRKELRNNLALKVLPVIQKDNHYHLLIDSPDCKRLNEVDDSFEFIKNKLFEIIKKMYLCDLRLLFKRNINAKLKSFQKIETSNDKFHIINYVTRDDKLLTNIDYTNINLAT
jgi:hypothetical protein